MRKRIVASADFRNANDDLELANQEVCVEPLRLVYG